jgi:integrase
MRAAPGGDAIEFLVLPSRPGVVKIPVAYTVEEVQRLIVLAGAREGTAGGQPAGWFWQTLVYSAWCTGERIGALLALRWGEVDTDARLLTFRAETRKGHTRDIQRSITPDLAQQLQSRRKDDSGLVWDWCADRDYFSLWPSMRLLCRRAGIRITGFHALRKASASYMAAGGGNAQEHLGHSSPTVTRDHYLDPRITGRQSGLEFLPKLDLEAPPPPVG